MNNKAHGTVSLTHVNDHYALSISNAGNYSGIPIPKISSLDVPFKMSVTVKGTHRGIYCENNNMIFSHYTPTNMRVVKAHKTQNIWTPQNSLNIGNITELRLELINNHGALTFKAFNGNTEVYTYSITDTTYDNTTKSVNFGLVYHSSTDIEFKDIIVELL